MITGATPQLDVKKLRQSLQPSPVPRLKTRRDGKSQYIMVNAPCTLYNLQGTPNPTPNRQIQFNSDGTVDLGVFATGFKVVEVGETEVKLHSEHKLIISTVMQLAVVGRGAWDGVMELVEKEGLGWNYG